MTNKVVAVIFFALGLANGFWPEFNGLIRAPSVITDGEARIASVILFVGAAIVWFMPQAKGED